MTDKQCLLTVINKIKLIIDETLEKFTQGNANEGFLSLIKLIDNLEELANMNEQVSGILYNAKELNDLLNSLFEAMNSRDVVMISDILEYRMMDFIDNVSVQVN